MLKMSGAQAPQGGFLEKLEANAGRLVRIRPVEAPAGDDASAVLARVEIDAAKADIAAALADIGKLPEAARATGGRLDRQSNGAADGACRRAAIRRRYGARAGAEVRTQWSG